MMDRPIKERGWPAYQHEVKALLDGRQTQFRRVIKRQPVGPVKQQPGLNYVYTEQLYTDRDRIFSCPYGQPGDRLWVRETIRYSLEHDNFYFDADNKGCGNLVYRGLKKKTCSSIHMPRWASRITLEVMGVRVERVQEIKEADVDAEGIFNKSGLHIADCHYQIFHPDQECDCGDHSVQEEFSMLWDSINAKNDWDANPWVWVIEFKVVHDG